MFHYKVEQVLAREPLPWMDPIPAESIWLYAKHPLDVFSSEYKEMMSYPGQYQDHFLMELGQPRSSLVIQVGL